MNARFRQSRSRVTSGSPAWTGLAGSRLHWVFSRLGSIGVLLLKDPRCQNYLIVDRPLLAQSLRVTLLGEVGRNDGDKGPALRDPSMRNLSDLVNSRTRLSSTSAPYSSFFAFHLLNALNLSVPRLLLVGSQTRGPDSRFYHLPSPLWFLPCTFVPRTTSALSSTLRALGS